MSLPPNSASVASRAADGAQQVSSIAERFLSTVPGSRLDNLGDGFLICEFGEHDERQPTPGLQKLRKQLRSSISHLMFEPDQPGVAPPQHGFRFLQRGSTVELRRHNCPVSLQDVANEKKSSTWSPASKTDKRGDDRSRRRAIDTGITSYSPHIGF